MAKAEAKANEAGPCGRCAPVWRPHAPPASLSLPFRVRPPQTPTRPQPWRSAQALQSSTTGQAAQMARAAPWPRRSVGKKSMSGWLRQAARACHAGGRIASSRSPASPYSSP